MQMELTMGQRITERRKMLGLSQEALGEQMGVSRQAISKWEADSAVPEVDKLIAMSRLFEVSVGWLLGTEAESEQRDGTGFSDAQIKTVEEIVRRCCPPGKDTPKRSGWRWIGYLCGGLALLTAIVILLGISTEVQSHTHQITGVQSGYASIRSALDILSGRLDELAAGERLLADFALDAEPFADWSGADVTFSGTPKAWKDGDAASLAIRQNGQEICRVTCDWDGGSCKARLQMVAADGYELCFLVIHADGTQEQQLLNQAEIQNLKTSLSLICTAQIGSVTVDHNKITVSGLHLGIKPPLYSGQTNALWRGSVEWVVVYNGETCSRKPVSGGEEILGGGSYGSNVTETFQIPDPKNGDTAEIYVETVLENGLRANSEAAIWRYENSTWKCLQ